MHHLERKVTSTNKNKLKVYKVSEKKLRKKFNSGNKSQNNEWTEPVENLKGLDN